MPLKKVFQGTSLKFLTAKISQTGIDDFLKIAKINIVKFNIK
jgi:hypothetical protein